MDAEKLGKSRFLNLFFKPSGAIMESRLRGWLMPPEKTLARAGVTAGQTLLEVGCGTGFFTLTAARMIGEGGHLTAIEPLATFAERVQVKIRDAGCDNVEVLRRDALESGLEDACIDLVLLLGVLPYPTLPLDRLLPEMHRVLKADGRLAVWLFPFSMGVPSSIAASGLFSELDRGNGVYCYRKT